jgi:hypothetical protein
LAVTGREGFDNESQGVRVFIQHLLEGRLESSAIPSLVFFKHRQCHGGVRRASGW